MKYEEKFTPEAAASIMNSCILLCDVVVAGKDAAVALKYDEENMFAPMIVFLEKDAPSDALIWAAETLGVPVVKNITLAKNLASHGKVGQAVPEASYRDVSLALARSNPAVKRRPKREFGKNLSGLPVKVERPLSVELGASIFALVAEGPGREVLVEQPLNAIRKKLVKLLGFSIPGFGVRCSRKLKDDEYKILFKGLEAGRGKLELAMNNPSDIPAAVKAVSSIIVRHVDEIIQRRAPELLGRDEVEAILDRAEEKHPVVTGEVKGLLSLGIIREIFQGLVSEQVSIRPIAVILETLADWGSLGPAPSELIIEQIRQSLKRQICLEYADDRLTLRVLTLESKLENRLVTNGGSADPRSADQGADWADLISPAVRGMEEKGFPPVILCSPRARSPVKEATRRKFPKLAVLSYMEIPSDISVEPLGEIRLEGGFR